jgi:hypothetical protein
VKPSDVLDQLAADGAAGRVYGEPYQTPDGTTVIPVVNPVGVFVIRNGCLAVLRQPPWPRITITDYR